MKTRPPFVGIAGIIGAGKSTLAKKLAEYLGWDVYYEPVKDNEYLDDFYGDMALWGFAMQIYLLNERFSLHQRIQWSDKPAIQDRTIWEDTIFAEVLCKDGFIHPRNWQTYLSLFNRMTVSLRKPNVILYLDVTVDTALARIKERGRDPEKNISREYLTHLQAGYEDFLKDMAQEAHILRMPWDVIRPVSQVAEILLPEIRRSEIRNARWE